MQSGDFTAKCEPPDVATAVATSLTLNPRQNDVSVEKPRGHLSPAQLRQCLSAEEAIVTSWDTVIHIDKRSLLEVQDPRHRYGKNLRAYYDAYKKLPVETRPIFFEWLDSTATELEECSFQELNTVVVKYCDAEERKNYVILIDDAGIMSSRCSNPAPQSHPEEAPGSLTLRRSEAQLQESFAPLTTGPDGWIFVIQHDTLYAGPKITQSSPRFHHSSFVSGEAVQAAGLMVAHQGRLTKLYGHSGHYRPSEYNIYQLLMYLKARGIDMTHVEVDVQRMLRINRINDAGVKEKKLSKCIMWPADQMLYFLRHKLRIHGVLCLLVPARTRSSATAPGHAADANALSGADANALSAMDANVLSAMDANALSGTDANALSGADANALETRTVGADAIGANSVEARADKVRDGALSVLDVHK